MGESRNRNDRRGGVERAGQHDRRGRWGTRRRGHIGVSDISGARLGEGGPRFVVSGWSRPAFRASRPSRRVGSTIEERIHARSRPPADRGLRLHRQPPHGRGDLTRGLHRLAVPARLRRPRLLHRDPRRARARTLAAHRLRLHRGRTHLRTRRDGAADDVHDADRTGAGHRPHADGVGPGRPAATRRGPRGHRDHAARVDRAALVRATSAVDPHRRPAAAVRRGRAVALPAHRRPAAAGARAGAAVRVRGARGRGARLRHGLGALAHRGVRADRRRRGDRRDDRAGPGVDGRLRLRRSAHGGRAPLAARAALPQPRGDRRARRRGDDVDAGGLRRRTQLGLPVLLAARRGAHAGGAARRGLPRQGGRVARLAAAGGRRRSVGDADHVPPRRRPRPARTRARPPARLPRFAPGASGQRRRRPAPDRRARRGDGGQRCRASRA